MTEIDPDLVPPGMFGFYCDACDQHFFLGASTEHWTQRLVAGDMPICPDPACEIYIQSSSEDLVLDDDGDLDLGATLEAIGRSVPIIRLHGSLS